MTKRNLKRLVEVLQGDNDKLKQENRQLWERNQYLEHQVDGCLASIDAMKKVLKNPFMRQEEIKVDNQVIRAVHALVHIPRDFPVEDEMIKRDMAREFAEQLMPYIDFKASNGVHGCVGYEGVLYIFDKASLYNRDGVLIVSDPPKRSSPFLSD